MSKPVGDRTVVWTKRFILSFLDLFEDVRELSPLVHERFASEVHQHLCLLVLFFFGVAPDVGNGVDLGTNRSHSTGLAVLNGEAGLCLRSDDLHGVQVDSGVWFGGWLRQAGGRAEDQVIREESVLADLLDTGKDSRFGGGRDNGHAVLSRFLQLLELGSGTFTLLGVCFEILDHLIHLLADIVVQLILGYGKVVFLLDGHHHAAEVLADEVFDELVASVAVRDALLLEDGVGEIGTCFEGEHFREDKSVVTVEEEIFDLREKVSRHSLNNNWVTGPYFRHVGG